MIEEQRLDRQIIRDALQGQYELIEASELSEIQEILQKNQISAILLSVGLEDDKGMDFLKYYHNQEMYHYIPVIATMNAEDEQMEQMCLDYGAWDLLNKPLHKKQVQIRVHNAVSQWELHRLNESRIYDKLTGLYNKQTLFQKIEEIVQANPDTPFVYIRLDITKFQLINSFYGMEEGDQILKYIADLMRKLCSADRKMIFGRLQGDIFAFCMPYQGEDQVIHTIEKLRKEINEYPIDYDIIPIFGIYLIRDHKEKANQMDDNANLASKHCKGSYIQNYIFYEASMGAQIAKEQKIVSTMSHALEDEQFVLYIQPKYDLHTNQIDGGEVLVRWIVPGKGMVSPGEFIPIFERNGFIMKLDYYVWEHACRIIRRWLDEGLDPEPISVNISRISLYNPNLVKIICDLVEKNHIPPKLLQLELTESAYTSNPAMIKEAMAQLQHHGFSILMDDFGSGYSSLNVLKDIVVDILKIDMRFLSESEYPGRGENILASVVRMAKWLKMPVIAEGVEKESQVTFLRGIGCEYVQGFYFAKPMPVEDYEKLAFEDSRENENKYENPTDDVNAIWELSPQMEMLFANMIQAVSICEYDSASEKLEAIHANHAYADMFGYHVFDTNNILDNFSKEHRAELLNCFEVIERTRGVSACEVKIKTENDDGIWLGIKLKYIGKVGTRIVVFCTISDISDQKKIEYELQRYRLAVMNSTNKVETILIVDDIRMNRMALRDIFEGEYNILEATNGEEALDIVKRNSHHIDIILLDVQMPVMDGPTFLRLKKEDIHIADIPVVIITVDDSPAQQVNAVSLGVDDYILKPFIPEVVVRRVRNVINSHRKVGELLKDSQKESQGDGSGRKDHLTGLYNRNTAGQMIQEVMQQSTGLQALLMIDIDNFKQVNETYGRSAGDHAIQEFAEGLKHCFRKSDILARYGGDEFIVFLLNIPSREFIRTKCERLINEIHPKMTDGVKLNYSIGISVVSGEDGKNHFMDLMGEADEALYKAKHKGKNQWYLYEKE